MGDALQVGAGVAALAALLVLLLLPAQATASTEQSTVLEVETESTEVRG
jgi:hypothetical protein